jgi:hypothetical protein
MDNFHKEIKMRLDQVNNRLIALEKEHLSLSTEQEHLQQLNELYEQLPYDSITEERRVTVAMLNSEKPKKPEQPQYTLALKPPMQHGKSIYDEVMELIFTTMPNPISLVEFYKQMLSLAKADMTYKHADQILRQAVKRGKIRKVGHGMYNWIGCEEIATTKTVSDGRCTETEES